MHIFRLIARAAHTRRGRFAVVGATSIRLIAGFGAGASGAWAQSTGPLQDIIATSTVTRADGSTLTTITFRDYSTVQTELPPAGAAKPGTTRTVFTCGSISQYVTSTDERSWRNKATGDVILVQRKDGFVDRYGNRVGNASLPWTGMWAPGLGGRPQHREPQKDCSLP